MECILVRTDHGGGGPLPADTRRNRAGPRAVVDVESLAEAEGRADPSVPPDCEGAKAGLLEDLGGHQGVVRDGMVRTGHTCPRGVGARPQGCHRALRPGRLGELLREADPRGGQRVDIRARLAVIAVGAESIRAQGVDQDEEQIEVVTRRERGDLGGAAEGPRVRTDFHLQGYCAHDEYDCGDDVERSPSENASRHGRTLARIRGFGPGGRENRRISPRSNEARVIGSPGLRRGRSVDLVDAPTQGRRRSSATSSDRPQTRPRSTPGSGMNSICMTAMPPVSIFTAAAD